MKHKLSPKSDSSTTDDVFVWDQITLWSKSAKCHIFQPSKYLLEHPQSVAFRQLRSTLQVKSILLILVITNIACRPLRTKYFCPWPRENLHTQPISWGVADFWTQVDWISKLAGVGEKVGSTHSGCRVTWGALWPWELTATFAPAPRITGEDNNWLQLLSKVLTLIVVCPWCSPNILACNCHGVLGEGDELASGEDIAGVNNTCN